MKQAWRLTGGDKQHHNNDDDSRNETALVNFKGKCHNCKKKSHKLKDRPEKEKGTTGSNEKATTVMSGNYKNVTCGHCKKTGHPEENCWVKHPSKVPEWAKDLRQNKKGETTVTAKTEVLVSVVQSKMDGDPSSLMGRSAEHSLTHG